MSQDSVFQDKPKTLKHRRLPDVARLLILVAIASGVLFLSTPLAIALNEPALAAWGMYTGLGLYGAALSHVLRRVFFPYLDLKSIAQKSCEWPSGAGMVFLGVCIVLAAFIVMMGSLSSMGK